MVLQSIKISMGFNVLINTTQRDMKILVIGRGAIYRGMHIPQVINFVGVDNVL